MKVLFLLSGRRLNHSITAAVFFHWLYLVSRRIWLLILSSIFLLITPISLLAGLISLHVGLVSKLALWSFRSWLCDLYSVRHWIFLSINKARNTDQSSYMGWNHRKHQPNGEGYHNARQKIPSIPWWCNLDQERWIWFRCYHGVIWWRRGVWTHRPVHVASSFTTVRYWFRRTLQGRWSHCPNPIQEASR